MMDPGEHDDIWLPRFGQIGAGPSGKLRWALDADGHIWEWDEVGAGWVHADAMCNRCPED